MQKRTIIQPTREGVVKTVDLPEACQRYGLGKATMRKVAEDASAVIRLGRRYLVNVAKVDLYMDAISGT